MAQPFFDMTTVKYIDLTHTLCDQVPTWDGSCGFDHEMIKDYNLKQQYQFRTYQIKMIEGIGTHIDAPIHCFSGGKAIHELSLNNLIAPCVVIDISLQAHEKYSLSVDDIKKFEKQYGTIQAGSFVIVYTGWDRFWDNKELYRNNLLFPSVSQKAAEFLLNRNVVGLGIDTLSADRSEDGFPVHAAFLGTGKYLVENIAHAKLLPAIGSYSFILPMKIKDGAEAAVRMIALVSQDAQ